MQPLEQGRSPSRFPLEAPVAAEQVHEVALVGDLELAHVLSETVEDVGGHEGWSRRVGLFVGAI